MIISDIMNKAFITDENTSLKNAAKIMSTKNIGSLIVVKDKKITGIITERDILSNISRIDASVSKIMTKKVITINSNDEVEEAAKLMSENKIKRLPVVENGKLVGIITMTDLIAHLKDINDEDFIFN